MARAGAFAAGAVLCGVLRSAALEVCAGGGQHTRQAPPREKRVLLGVALVLVEAHAAAGARAHWQRACGAALAGRGDDDRVPALLGEGELSGGGERLLPLVQPDLLGERSVPAASAALPPPPSLPTASPRPRGAEVGPAVLLRASPTRAGLHALLPNARIVSPPAPLNTLSDKNLLPYIGDSLPLRAWFDLHGPTPLAAYDEHGIELAVEQARGPTRRRLPPAALARRRT